MSSFPVSNTSQKIYNSEDTSFQHLNIHKNIVTPFFELMKKNIKTNLTLNCLVLQYQICKKKYIKLR